jgi:hypothetical protein
MFSSGVGDWFGREEASFLEPKDSPKESLVGLDTDALLLARLARRRAFLGAFLFLTI